MSASVLLSVLIPVYNEVATIATCIERVEAADVDKELIVIDDGSNDGTSDVLRRLARDRDPARFTLIRQPHNIGKGASLRRAIPVARGQVTVVQDADLEYDPRDYPILAAPILRGDCDVVHGSRRIDGANRYPFDRFYLGAWLLTTLTNLLYGSQLTDVCVGYKAYRTATLQSLDLICDGFEFCTEATAKLLNRRVQILEVPIRYQRRTVADGKKIMWKDGIVGALTLLRCRRSG